MADRDCQRKGFGEAILHGVLQRIMADLSLHRVYISFEPDTMLPAHDMKSSVLPGRANH